MTVNSIVLCKRRQHLHAIVLGQHYDLTNCSRQKTNWNHVEVLHCNVLSNLYTHSMFRMNLKYLQPFQQTYFITVISSESPKHTFAGAYSFAYENFCYSSNDLVTTRPPWPTFAEHRDGGQYFACWLRRWWTTFTEIKSRHNFISAH